MRREGNELIATARGSQTLDSALGHFVSGNEGHARTNVLVAKDAFALTSTEGTPSADKQELQGTGTEYPSDFVRDSQMPLYNLHGAASQHMHGADLFPSWCSTQATCWLQAGDSGDAVMMEVFDEIVAPAAVRFQPDIILVKLHFHLPVCVL